MSSMQTWKQGCVHWYTSSAQLQLDLSCICGKLSWGGSTVTWLSHCMQDYFISGKGEMADYDPNCLFADPFVSFKGVDRFKKNVSNLGALM